MRPRVSIRGFVHPSVRPKVRSLGPSGTLSLKRCETHLIAGIGTCSGSVCIIYSISKLNHGIKDGRYFSVLKCSGALLPNSQNPGHHCTFMEPHLSIANKTNPGRYHSLPDGVRTSARSDAWELPSSSCVARGQGKHPNLSLCLCLCLTLSFCLCL